MELKRQKDGFIVKEKETPLAEKLEEWIKNNKTSWEYLKNHGFKDSESYGDCIFLNFGINGINDILSPKENLNKIIKEAVARLNEFIEEMLSVKDAIKIQKGMKEIMGVFE